MQERLSVPAATCAALKAPATAHVTRLAVPEHAKQYSGGALCSGGFYSLSRNCTHDGGWNCLVRVSYD